MLYKNEGRNLSTSKLLDCYCKNMESRVVTENAVICSGGVYFFPKFSKLKRSLSCRMIGTLKTRYPLWRRKQYCR